MKKYEYAIYQLKVQSNIKGLNVAVTNKIQEYTVQGFEFYSQVYVPVAITPGCLGSLLGGKTQYLNAPLFIFRKEIQEYNFMSINNIEYKYLRNLFT